MVELRFAGQHRVFIGPEILETVIQENVNPVEKVERSLMIVGTTIHRRPAAELLADDQRERFFATSPRLGPAAADPSHAPSTEETPEPPRPPAEPTSDLGDGDPAKR